MSWLDEIALWWQSRKTRRKMDRVFSRAVDPYRYAQNVYELKRLAEMESALGQRRYARALEVGCAEGLFTERMAKRCGALTAVDISEVALERAKRRVPSVDAVCADVRSWKPKAADFDLIVLGDVLYYLDKPMVRAEFERVFERVRGWMAPGSRLILAHAFATPQERVHRQGFTRRFEALGLKLLSEGIVKPDDADNPVRCLVAVLEKIS